MQCQKDKYICFPLWFWEVKKWNINEWTSITFNSKVHKIIYTFTWRASQSHLFTMKGLKHTQIDYQSTLLEFNVLKKVKLSRTTWHYSLQITSNKPSISVFYIGLIKTHKAMNKCIQLQVVKCLECIWNIFVSR